MQLWICGGKIVQLHEGSDRSQGRNIKKRKTGKGTETPSADGDTTDTDDDDEADKDCT